MNKEEYDKRYFQIIKERGFIVPVLGVFSELVPNESHIEEQKVESPNGFLTKFIGCDYRYKVNTNRELHFDATALKGAYMESLKFVLKHKILIPFLYLWRWDVIKWAYWLYHKRMENTTPLITHFSPMCRELIRAGKKLAERIPLVGTRVIMQRRFWVESLITAFVAFIQSSSTYYVHAQDMLCNLHGGDARKEWVRVLELGLTRSHSAKDRIESIVKAVRLAMMFPAIRRIAQDFLDELDMSQFNYDEEDLYFAYRKEHYDTGGLPYNERREYVQRADKEHNHCILYEML